MVRSIFTRIMQSSGCFLADGTIDPAVEFRRCPATVERNPVLKKSRRDSRAKIVILEKQIPYFQISLDRRDVISR